MKKIFVMIVVVLASLSLWLLTSCSSSPVASGTETGNPDVIACAAAMARQSRNALATGGKWQPSHYMDSAGNSRNVLALTNASSAGGLSKQLATLDTLLIHDTVKVIFDTVYYYNNVSTKDTAVIYDTLLVVDTISDTISKTSAADSVSLIQKRIKVDTVYVRDTVVTPATRYVPYRKINMRVVKANGDTLLYIQCDSLWSSPEYFNNTVPADSLIPAITTGESHYDAVTVSFSRMADSAAVAGEKTGTAVILFVPVNYAVPAGSKAMTDTLFVKVDNNDLFTSTSQSFLTAQKTVNSTVVFRVAYDVKQSVLTCMDFYPLATDTVESLTVAYAIDPGALASTADDQLLSIGESVVYRLGGMKSMELDVTPDAAKPVTGGVDPDKGLANVTAAYADAQGKSHAVSFEGIVDRVGGFSGVLTYDTVRYSVFVDAAGTVSAREVK